MELVIGIEDVTRTCQEMISEKRQILSCILLCKADASSPLLYSHLPTMTWVSGFDVRIAPLLAGSEERLITCLGQSPVIAIGIKVPRAI